MTQMKTLKDLRFTAPDGIFSNDIVEKSELREAARVWVEAYKKFDSDDIYNHCVTPEQFIKHFFNLEDDKTH